MMLHRRDWVMRMVKQLTDALARILGLRKAGRHDEALALIGDTLREVLGEVVDVAERVDEKTAASLLGHADAIRAYAQLLTERAAVREEMQDVPGAATDRMRALRMHLAAVAQTGTRVDAATHNAIMELARRVDTTELTPDHHALLERVRGHANGPP
ncbi:MAG: hypothetical protein AB2A00_21375 [Myxococcota bacterium]